MQLHKRIAATLTTATTSSSAIPIRGANRVALELPLYASGIVTATANVYVQVCDTATGTFRRAVVNGVYSGGSGLLDFEVPSSTGNRIVDCPWLAGYNYMKIETNNVTTANYAAYVHIIQ
jgi:hypothetical protein